MSRFDSAFCLSGDAALESPAFERIDDLQPIEQMQYLCTPSAVGNMSDEFPNADFFIGKPAQAPPIGTPEFAGYPFGIPQQWPFVVHTIRIRGYMELVEDEPSHTAFPAVQNIGHRILLNAARYTSDTAPAGWDPRDDIFAANTGGPAGVTLFDRLFIFPSVQRAVSNPSRWFFGTGFFSQVDRAPGYPQPYQRTTFAGRYDPPSYDATATGYVNEPNHAIRNLAQLNNLTPFGVVLQPGYQPDEQRALVIKYQPRRGEAWFDPIKIDLPPN